jgi:hypothetical protein
MTTDCELLIAGVFSFAALVNELLWGLLLLLVVFDQGTG